MASPLPGGANPNTNAGVSYSFSFSLAGKGQGAFSNLVRDRGRFQILSTPSKLLIPLKRRACTRA